MDRHITKVVIYNFQSVKRMTLNLVSGVNVFIGPSDDGKSAAAIRSIGWVKNNRPLGDSYRSEWGGTTRVAIHFNDGNKVERFRSDKENLYIINGVEYKAFGSEPPEEVAQIFQMDSFNVQSQNEPPFLLSLSPGEAAKVLNRAASIDDIDHTVSALRRTKMRLDQDIQYADKDILKYSNELQTYDMLEAVELWITSLEDDERLAQQLKASRDRLESLVLDTHRMSIRLDSFPDLDTVNTKLNRVTLLLDKYRTATQSFSVREGIIQNLEDIAIRSTRIGNTNKADTCLTTATTGIDMLRRFTSQKASLSKLLDEVEQLDYDWKYLDRNIKKLEQSYHKLMPSECPLCGSPIQEKK